MQENWDHLAQPKAAGQAVVCRPRALPLLPMSPRACTSESGKGLPTAPGPQGMWAQGTTQVGGCLFRVQAGQEPWPAWPELQHSTGDSSTPPDHPWKECRIMSTPEGGRAVPTCTHHLGVGGKVALLQEVQVDVAVENTGL